MTHPIGTSPAFSAISAHFSAKSMKEGAVMPRILGRNLLVAAPSAKVDTGFAWECGSAGSAHHCHLYLQARTRPFMPRDNDKDNDSRGRRDRPSGGKGRSGAARGPEKKFAKRGFGKSEGGKRPYAGNRDDRPPRGRDDDRPRREIGRAHV